MPAIPLEQTAQRPARSPLPPLSVSINDAAASLGVSRPSIYKLAREGKLALIKIAGRSLIRFADLERLVMEAA